VGLCSAANRVDCYRHLTLILSVFRYSLSWIRMNYHTRMAQFSYRLAFLSAMLTYGIVVYKTLRARAKAGMKPSPQVAISLIADENVQYFRTLPLDPTP
jgi:transmembrane protein 33